MQVWLFGNPDLPEDSLPCRLLPLLKKEFSLIDFVMQDPLEEWPESDRLVIIDTVVGLSEVRIFNSLADFGFTPLVTMHDYDLKSELSFRAKLGKLPVFTIIGLPPLLSEVEALAALKPILSEYST